MTSATALAPKPDKRQGAPTTARPLTDFVNSNANKDSATALRLQRLRPFGVVGQRANLIAYMAWELSFMNRIATARPYRAERPVAVEFAKAEGAHLSIGAMGKRIRRFNPGDEMQEPRT